MSEFNKIENAKAELVCVAEGDKWADAKKKAFNKVLKNLEIKGFRKGLVPANIGKKYIDNSQVLLEAADELAQGLLDEGIAEHKIDLIDNPSLAINEIDEDHCKMTFTCPVEPDVELGDYKSLEYKVEEVEVTDEEIEAEITRVQEQKADLELKEDGEVENGDVAVIDFEGFKDGVAFDGGKGENYDLEIGSNTFIPGFEDQLIGMKAEEEKEINVTFPEDYQAEELKGQAVIFKVKVHEIKKKVLPEVDEELIADLKLDGVTNIDELKDFIKNSLTKAKTEQAENAAVDELIDKLTTQMKVEIPEVMINREIDNLIQEYDQNLMAQGMSFAQFKQITGQSDDDIRNMVKDEAEKKVKTTLALKNIAKLENVEVTDEDVENTYKELDERYQGMGIELIKQYIPEYQVRDNLTFQKALDLLKK